MTRSWRFLLILVLTAAGPLAASDPASDSTSNWPQLRGSRSGHSSATDLPVTWSETENVAWKVPIPGRGFSSPVVLGGQIWLTTAFEDDLSLRALGLDAETGKILFNIEVLRPAAWRESHAENSYASPTPALEPGRAYVHFGTYGTAALSTESGKILWINDQIDIDHEVGPGSSPILWRDLLIVNCDGTDKRYVAALDKNTGVVAWRSRRTVPLGTKNAPHRKAFSTPIVIETDDQPRLISSGADQVSALNLQTGREIWRVRYEGYSVVPQPVAGPEHVYVDTGYIKPHLLAIRLGGQGDVTDTHVEWNYHWQVPANPTPLLIDRRLFMVSDWGHATWLDVERGEDIWRQRLGGQHWASPLVVGERIIYTWNSDGETIVLEAADQYREIARNQLDGKIRMTPAIAGQAFYIPTTTHLYRIEKRPAS